VSSEFDDATRPNDDLKLTESLLDNPPPDPLDYESPEDRKQRKSAVHDDRYNAVASKAAQVIYGLVAGGMISGIVWGLALRTTRIDLLPSLVGLLAIKIISGIFLVEAGPRTRYLGVGVMLSIGLVGLVFVGVCATGLSNALRH
jgi:hypothetical protein